MSRRTAPTASSAPAVGDVLEAPAHAVASRYWGGATDAAAMAPGSRAVVIALAPTGWHLQRVTDGALFTLGSACNRLSNGARPWRIVGSHLDADAYADAIPLDGLEAVA